MCLDVLRALAREPEAAMGLLDELAREGADEPRLADELRALRQLLGAEPAALESQARRLTTRLVLVAQACLMRRRVPLAVADAFVATRLNAQWGPVVGALDAGALPVDLLLARALPDQTPA
jgi:putative acyl-CoA dehydrogenase